MRDFLTCSAFFTRLGKLRMNECRVQCSSLKDVDVETFLQKIEDDPKKYFEINKAKMVPVMTWDKEMFMELTDYSSWDNFTLIPKKKYLAMGLLEIDMFEFYNRGKGTAVPFEYVSVNGFYAGHFKITNTWSRIQVKEVGRAVGPASPKFKVKLLDYGRTAWLGSEDLYLLNSLFCKQPRKSIDCSLPLFQYAKQNPRTEMDKFMTSNIGQIFLVRGTGLKDNILQVSFLRLEKVIQQMQEMEKKMAEGSVSRVLSQTP